MKLDWSNLGLYRAHVDSPFSSWLYKTKSKKLPKKTLLSSAKEHSTASGDLQPHAAPGREKISQTHQEVMETRRNCPPSSHELGFLFPLNAFPEGILQ